MQNDIIVLPPAVLSRFKKKAKRMQRETGRPHHELLEEVALEHGFANWHQVTLADAATRELERRFASELYLLMDIKEALDTVDDNLVISHEMLALKDQELLAWLRANDEDPGDESDEELREFLHDNFLCLRYVGKKPLPLKENLDAFVRELAFWPPDLIWLRGEVVDRNGPRPGSHEDYDGDSSPDEPMPVIDKEVLRAAFGTSKNSKLILGSPGTMEAYKAFSGPRKSWHWCLHCERAYPLGSYRQEASYQMCPYAGCDGDAVLDLWKWPMVQEKNPGYPVTPEISVVYSLNGPNSKPPKRRKR